MKEAGVERNIVAYTALVGAIWQTGAPGWQAEVDAVVAEMQEAGVAPDLRFVEERMAARLGGRLYNIIQSGRADVDPQQVEEAAADFQRFEATCTDVHRRVSGRLRLVARDL